MTSDARPVLTLAHSPDPDDVFMWWPITGMVDPRDPDRVLRPPVLDTGRFRFRSLPADIAVLNRRAVERGGGGDLEITALSIFAWAHVRDRYALTACGSSMGYGYGPKVVARAGSGVSIESLRAGRPVRLAIPGERTTAYLVFRLMVGAAGRPSREGGPIIPVEMPFDRILDAVAHNVGGVDAGLLIHQAQLTYEALGLEEVADVGRWWLDTTGLPLPLGGNAIRRDLDDVHGRGTIREVVAILDASIRHALAHREESMGYALTFAPELGAGEADRYIDMYVNDLTIDADARDGAGRRAIQRLLSDAHAAGLSPDPGVVELVRA